LNFKYIKISTAQGVIYNIIFCSGVKQNANFIVSLQPGQRIYLVLNFIAMRNPNITSYILTAFLVFAMTSCEKEKPLSEAIIGKWEVTSMKQITYTNDVKKSEVTIFFEAGEMAYQFVEGGSGIYSEGADDHLFSWSLSGSIITISELFTQDLVVEASIDGDLLTWSYKTQDEQNPSNTLEYIMTAKKVS